MKGSEDAVFSGVISANAEGVVLDDINMDFEGTNSEAAGNLYGQIMINANNVQLKNCNIYAYYTEGSANVGGALGVIHTNYNTDIVMDNCVIQTNTMGIFPAMTSGEIKNCTFKPLDEGDTRVSLAINGVSNTTISGNTFYGMRILPSGGITVEDNKFIDFSGSPFYMSYYNEAEPINISDNYWGENPDFTKILGTSGKLVIDTYYVDSDLTVTANVDNMTQVTFGGTLEGAEISPDGMTLSQGDEVVTAWKGEVEGGVNGDITVTATSGEDTAKTTLTAPSVEGNALFYVLVNAQPDGMVFTYSNTSAE